jgi:transcriptional regulator with XRE-family HTH domain
VTLFVWQNRDVGQHLKWHVGDVIRKLRGRQQALKFAAAAGVDKDILRRVEAGTGNPTFETLNKIARALGTDVETLLALVPVQREHAPPTEVDELAELCEAVRLAYRTDPYATQFLDAVWDRYAAPEAGGSSRGTERTPVLPADPRPAGPGTRLRELSTGRRRLTAADTGRKAPAKDE